MKETPRQVSADWWSVLVVDLEWNRKTIFEKLDWLKSTLEDVIAKGNHNVDVQQKQILAITARLSALEKPVRKSTSVRKSAPAKATEKKKPHRVPLLRLNRSAQPKRKR